MKKAKIAAKGKALFIGRFQPFHNGHLKVIKDILWNNTRITIVIGGPAKPDSRNPFSFDERKKMIEIALEDEGISKSNYKIFKIADINDDEKWNAKVKRLGKFDAAYSRNQWVVRCLKKIEIPVKKHAFYERYKNCGRVIRQRILEGKEWKTLVPPSVYEYVRCINGEERIK